MYKLNPELPDQLRKPIELKRYCVITYTSCVHWVCLFIYFYYPMYCIS
jgi:hypothetical protein